MGDSYWSSDIVAGYYVETAVVYVLIAIQIWLFTIKLWREYQKGPNETSHLAYSYNRIGSIMILVEIIQVIDHRGVHGLYPLEFVFVLSGTQVGFAYCAAAVYAYVLVKAATLIKQIHRSQISKSVHRLRNGLALVVIFVFIGTYVRVGVVSYTNSSLWFGLYLVVYLNGLLGVLAGLFMTFLFKLRSTLTLQLVNVKPDEPAYPTLTKAKANLDRAFYASFPVVLAAMAAQLAVGIGNIVNNTTVDGTNPQKYQFGDGVFVWLIAAAVLVLAYVSWEKSASKSLAPRVFNMQSVNSSDHSVLDNTTTVPPSPSHTHTTTPKHVPHPSSENLLAPKPDPIAETDEHSVTRSVSKKRASMIHSRSYPPGGVMAVFDEVAIEDDDEEISPEQVTIA